MNKKIEYYSTDKVYKIKKRKLTKLGLLTFSILLTIILVITAFISFRESVTLSESDRMINYNEVGNVDYKIYLKDNDYYEGSYLNSGMQYVASLIKTINVKFSYKMHATEKLDFSDKYRIVGELRITERDDPSKVLYRKTENLLEEKSINVNANNFAINEEIDIDYDKYNEIVNAYKKDLGLIVSSNLILKLETNTEGTTEETEDKLIKNSSLQMTIPLSEATLNIKMDTDEIDNSGTLGKVYNVFKIHNEPLFIIFILLTIVSLISAMIDIYLYIKYFKKDIYRNKVNKLLNDYDRLIVNGRMSIDESRYPNKIYPETFEEMVDAAQNLEVPIMYYEPIPGEKSFFVIVKDDTLYKYRLTRAFLEKNPTNKVEKEVKETKNEVIEPARKEIQPSFEEEIYEDIKESVDEDESKFEEINEDPVVEETIEEAVETPIDNEVNEKSEDTEDENIEEFTMQILQEELKPTEEVVEKKAAPKKKKTTTTKKTPAKKTTTKKSTTPAKKTTTAAKKTVATKKTTTKKAPTKKTTTKKTTKTKE